MFTFHVISVFPEPIRAYTESSILGRGQKAKKFKVVLHNLWDNVKKGERVDGRPYGGGPGMVLRAEPIMKVLNKIGVTWVLDARTANSYPSKYAAKRHLKQLDNVPNDAKIIELLTVEDNLNG